MSILFANRIGKTFLFDLRNIESAQTNLYNLTNGNFKAVNYKFVSDGAWSARAEYFNGTVWGTICDDSFNITAADVFCDL